MAFFNLTSLGYQDPIRSQIVKPNPVYSYKILHQIPEGSYVSFRPPASKLPPINMNKYNQVVQPGHYDEHGGSYVTYTRRLRKHTRPAKGEKFCPPHLIQIVNFYSALKLRDRQMTHWAQTYRKGCDLLLCGE